MAIEEKQRALEFTFIPKEMTGDLKYDMIYDDRDKDFPLEVSIRGGGSVKYPLSLFIEVVDFLAEKGIIKREISQKRLEASNLFSSDTNVKAYEEGITVPEIVRTNKGKGLSEKGNIDPLSSFDITSSLIAKYPAGDDDEKLSQSNKDDTEATLPIPDLTKIKDTEKQQVTPLVKNTNTITSSVQSKKISPELQAELSSRPVIRSRVSGDDPMSAEREASIIRAAQGKGAGKTIKSRHEAQ
jgi:hypothetical protein